MGQTFDRIDENLSEFLLAQHMFFVATAPLSGDGYVNVSPKGLDSFRILNDRQVAYVDLSGSGIETLAHVKENARLVLMFCAFEGPPKIVRLHGRARALERSSAEFADLEPLFPSYASTRAILIVDLTRISDSCGFTVPFYDYRGQRDLLLRSGEKKGPQGIRASQLKSNMKSLDELPGLDTPSIG